MSTEFLTQILLIVAIVALVMLIANLWRLWGVMERIDRISRTVDARVTELDHSFKNTRDAIETYKEAFKGFLLSFETAKFIKDKLGDLTSKHENKDKKEEQND